MQLQPGKIAHRLRNQRIVGAFPVFVDHVVAQQPRQHREVLDCTVAAQHLNAGQNDAVRMLARAHFA